MKKLSLLSFLLLSACGTVYTLNMKTLLPTGNNKTVCVISIDKNIETVQYKMFFKDWLRLSGFNVVDKNCQYLFGFTSNINSHSYMENVADYGVVGIDSINTHTNSYTNGSLYGSSQYLGGGYTSYNGSLSANTNSYSTTNVNYKYGITGYHQELQTLYWTTFDAMMMNLSNKDIVFESKLSVNQAVSKDNFIKRVITIYSQHPMQNIKISYLCDANGCKVY
jgi:hypothetical protein